jgi:hypothetical protein
MRDSTSGGLEDKGVARGRQLRALVRGARRPAAALIGLGRPRKGQYRPWSISDTSCAKPLLRVRKGVDEHAADRGANDARRESFAAERRKAAFTAVAGPVAAALTAAVFGPGIRGAALRSKRSLR